MIELTIAIPTYNRAQPLERLLECLCTQSGIADVQVLVSDNGSTDVSRDVARAFSHSLNLKLVGFSENRGFDANYLNCVANADGLHLWIVGDDDALTEGAVQTVLSLIRSQSPDIIVCNGGDHRADGLRPRIEARFEDGFSSTRELMSQVGWHLCWIGTCIVKHTLYRPSLVRNSDFNAFIHLPLLVNALPTQFSSAFVSRVLIHTTVNNSDYFKDPSVLVETFGKRLFETLGCLGDNDPDGAVRRTIVRSFHARLSMFGLRDFLNFRVDPRFNASRFLRRIVYFYRVNPASPLFLVLFLVPLRLLKTVVEILKAVRRWQKKQPPAGVTGR